jgi:hypothetical protein
MRARFIVSIDDVNDLFMRACVRIQHESLAGKRSLAVGVRVSNVTRHDVTRNFFMCIQSPFFIACACNTVEHSSFMCMPASGVSISSLLFSASFSHVCDPSPSTQFSGFISSLSCKTNEVHLPQHAAAVPSIHHTMHASFLISRSAIRYAYVYVTWSSLY